MFTDKMLDRDAFARWFGQYASAPKYPDMDWRPEEPMEVQALRERLAGDVPLLRNPASRFSFIRRNENSVLLFVDGQCFECVQETAVLAEQICAKGPIKIDPEQVKSDSDRRSVVQGRSGAG